MKSIFLLEPIVGEVKNGSVVVLFVTNDDKDLSFSIDNKIYPERKFIKNY